MFSYLVRRVLQLLLVVWGAITLVFFLYFALPDDPATLLAGGGNKAVPESVVRNTAKKYGLDKPIMVQYGTYLKNVATLDFGESFAKRGETVGDVIAERAPASIRLAIWAMAIEAGVGISLGIVSAKRKNSFADTATTVTAAVASAIPVFVLGYVLQQITGVFPNQHGWPDWARLPVQKIGPNEWYLGFIPSFDQLRYLIQPAIVLASVSAVIVARLTRTTMMEHGKSEYVRTARAKGLKEGQVTRRHVLRNAMIPVITFIGIDFGTIITAAILTETVFYWPGLGSKLVSAADARDLPVLLGLTVVVVLIYGIANLLVDLSYAWFDPRVRVTQKGAK
jgi:ABC-type dipeptide/oligopeptide/nickel transport system permease component